MRHSKWQANKYKASRCPIFFDMSVRPILLLQTDSKLNSTVSMQATSHFGHLAKPLVLGVIPAFRPPAVMTFRGHCRNVGTNLQPAARPYSRNSVICRATSLAS